jgi:hypothetical protein
MSVQKVARQRENKDGAKSAVDRGNRNRKSQIPDATIIRSSLTCPAGLPIPFHSVTHPCSSPKSLPPRRHLTSCSTTMTRLPSNIVFAIASFCAGTYNFRTLVNVALASKEINEGLKPLLNHPVLVWTKGWDANDRFPMSNDFLMTQDIKDHPKWNELQPVIAAWSRVE